MGRGGLAEGGGSFGGPGRSGELGLWASGPCSDGGHGWGVQEVRGTECGRHLTPGTMPAGPPASPSLSPSVSKTNYAHSTQHSKTNNLYKLPLSRVQCVPSTFLHLPLIITPTSRKRCCYDSLSHRKTWAQRREV